MPLLLALPSSFPAADASKPQVASPTPTSPNVIIIYSDDHGYTDLGLFGIDSNVDTPNMDRLARNGAVMAKGYSSAPQCRPSRVELMAGRIQNDVFIP